MKKAKILLLLFGFLFITSCANADAQPMPTATQIPSKTNTPKPTTTPLPTPTPTPTLTPKPPPTSVPFQPFLDDFNQAPEPGWTWIREDPLLWNLIEHPGFLRIHLSPHDGTEPKNMLLRPAPEGDFEIITRVVFRPFANFHGAGLTIYQDADNFINLVRATCYLPTVPGRCVANGIYFDNTSNKANFPTETINPAEVILRLTREGDIYTAYFSEDEESWTLIGRHESDLIPSFVGIYVTSDWENPIIADFDYFTVEEIP